MVAAAAALWGTDALFRRGLALDLDASLVVAGEHLVLVLLTAPLLVAGWRTARARFGPAEWTALIVIGAGASAVATTLFTQAFTYGDPTTPLLLQKLQPLFAIAGARALLGERLTPRFVPAAVVALAGAWLIAFPDPTDVGVQGLAPALLAVGAAALWGAGTVLGRRLSPLVTPGQLTALRFGIGLPTAVLIVVLTGAAGAIATADAGDVGALVALALVPGLAGIALYYRGLRTTPASLATLAELAFPLSTIVVNRIAFGTVLTTSQWAGVALLTGTVTVLGVLGRGGPRRVGVQAPVRAPAGDHEHVRA